MDGQVTWPVPPSYDDGDLMARPAEPQSDEELLARAVRVLRNLCDWFGVTPQWSVMVVIDDFDADSTHAAQVVWVPLYKKITVTVGRKQMNQLCDREFVQYLAHEVIHTVFAPLDDMIGEETGRKSYVFFRYSDLREGVVDSITNLFMKAWEGGETTFYTRVVKP